MAYNPNNYKYITGKFYCSNVSTLYQPWGNAVGNYYSWLVSFENVKMSGAGILVDNTEGTTVGLTTKDHWRVGIDSNKHPYVYWSRSSTYRSTQTFTSLTVNWNEWFSISFSITTNAASPTITCTLNSSSATVKPSGRWNYNYTHQMQVGDSTTTIRGTVTVRGYPYQSSAQSANNYRTATFNLDDMTVGATSVTVDGYTYSLSSAVQLYQLIYTITYNSHGATSTPSTQTVIAGNSATLASAVTWANGSGSLTHTFNANGGTPTTTKSTTITYAYSFNGWHESSTTGTNHGAGSSWAPSGNVTLHAGWNTTTTYGGLSFPSNPTWASAVATATRTVTLNANGGAVTSTQLKSTQTTTTSHTFNNWWTAASGGTQVNTSKKPTTGTTYYAHWNTTTTTGNWTAVTLPTPTYTTSTSTKNITITYNGNGGTISPTSTTRTVTTNTTHTFNGWHEGSATGTNHNAGSYTPSGNITLVANWNHSTVTTTTTLGTIPTSGTKTSSTSTATRTITFNANGGSVSPTSRNSTQTTTITYPFDGMYTAASGGNKISTSTATNANTTYYAHWGTSTSTGAWTAVTLPTPTWSIHKVTGWYTASSGGTKRGNAGASYTPTTAETLYAQWVSGLHANVSGTWKPATAAYVKVDGTWKTATAVWIKVSGTWTKL